MFTKNLFAFLLLLTTFIFTPASQALDREAAGREWTITGSCPGGICPEVYSTSNFALKNNDNNSWVKYGEREYGINLVWSNTASSTVSFKKQSGDVVIRYGDRIALRFSGGSGVVYGERRWGINLVWTSNIVYEWEITGGTRGQALHINDRFGLLNRQNNDLVVHCQRATGIDLMWASDCTRISSNSPITTSIGMRRQEIVSGFIPYAGTFGPITSGAVISRINFPTQFPAVALLKPGHSTAECGNSAAFVLVHGDMTDEQKRAVWGTADIRISG